MANKQCSSKKCVKFDDSPFYGREEFVRSTDCFDTNLCPLSFYSSTSSLELPRKFQAHYLGYEVTEGLWGLKNVRQPVDHLVRQAKTWKSSTSKKTTYVHVTLSESGILLEQERPEETTIVDVFHVFPIETIAYGVQDTHYTRVFAIISIQDELDEQTLHCHVFLCHNSLVARKAAQSLATAFHIFGESLSLPGYCSHIKKGVILNLKKDNTLQIPSQQHENADQCDKSDSEA